MKLSCLGWKCKYIYLVILPLDCETFFTFFGSSLSHKIYKFSTWKAYLEKLYIKKLIHFCQHINRAGGIYENLEQANNS